MDIKTYKILTTNKYALIKTMPVLVLFVIVNILNLWFVNHSRNINIILLLLMLLVVAYNFLYLRSYKYFLDTEKIIIHKGLFSLTKDFIELYRVKDYKQSQTFMDRLLNIMTLTIYTSDKTYPILYMKGLQNSKLIFLIRKRVEDQRRIKHVREFD